MGASRFMSAARSDASTRFLYESGTEIDRMGLQVLQYCFDVWAIASRPGYLANLRPRVFDLAPAPDSGPSAPPRGLPVSVLAGKMG
jgi:hypothetical protein